MDFPSNLKLQILKLVIKLAEYEQSFTVGTIIDILSKNGCWPQNINKVNAYFRVQQIVDDLLPNLDYDVYLDEMVNIYVPKKLLKILKEEQEEQQDLTEEDIIAMTAKNIPVDVEYEFTFPKFNKFWDKRWKKFF